MQAKTTRAFRTISEAGEELGLQPHVLRFWESKFVDIKPVKRGGGRRFYRPEDIEFLRGIKTLLHDEKHPIKDVQKLIKKSGANRIVELGRSVEKASRERSLSDMSLVPERINKPALKVVPQAPQPVAEAPTVPEAVEAQTAPIAEPVKETPTADSPDTGRLEDALSKLERLRDRWKDFDTDKDAG